MTAFIGILCLVLIAVVVVQIGRIVELASDLQDDKTFGERDRGQGPLLLGFGILFLIGCVISALYYKDSMLGYGPHISASEHGAELDSLFNVTLFFTGIVFVVTQFLLFYFGHKYRHEEGRKALYMPHDNTLEIIWTVIPAVVMTYLVIGGLNTWNKVMADVGTNEDVMEIEATGQQFNWLIRYPGPDGLLGGRYFREITGTNPLGQLWDDTKNWDDLQPSEIVLPVNQKVRVRITAKDVLHNFYLPHFRVKMDAVPGMPTYFVFTPRTTTEEYRQRLKDYPDWQTPSDPNDPNSAPRWKEFKYELACAEMCGNGHFSMNRTVRIVSQEEYDAWLEKQVTYFQDSQYYKDEVQGKANDPFVVEEPAVPTPPEVIETDSSATDGATDENAGGDQEAEPTGPVKEGGGH